ncbi:hypothetical protein HN51_004336 [Arachis hypogaea]
MASGDSCGTSYRRRVKGSGDGSVSSASAHDGRFRVAKGETPRCHCGTYAIVVESGMEKNSKRPFFGCPFHRKTPHCDFFVWFDRVFQCDGHGGEDDDALAEKVKKLKELLDAFEKKNKNAVENRRWCWHDLKILEAVAELVAASVSGDVDWVGLCGAVEMVSLGEGAGVDGGVGAGVECSLLIGCLGFGGLNVDGGVTWLEWLVICSY